jgi:hypothetical protein
MFRGVVVPSRSGSWSPERDIQDEFIIHLPHLPTSKHRVTSLNTRIFNSTSVKTSYVYLQKLIFVNISTRLMEIRTCYSLIVSPFQDTALPCPAGSKRDSVATLRAERSRVRSLKRQNVQNGFRAFVVSIFHVYRKLVPLAHSRRCVQLTTNPI